MCLILNLTDFQQFNGTVVQNFTYPAVDIFHIKNTPLKWHKIINSINDHEIS